MNLIKKIFKPTKKQLLEENKILKKSRKNIHNILIRFKKEGHSKMRVVDSELVLLNQDFNELFDNMVNKFMGEELKISFRGKK